MWSLSQAVKARPSDVLGIADSFVAFAVDRALWIFASAIEDEQNQAVNRLPDNAKEAAHTRARQRVLDKYLGVELVNEPARFKSPGR